ncbi:retrovirus-related pol polyprotein from transposon TNT 1-94 [Tanacetum coccineum]
MLVAPRRNDVYVLDMSSLSLNGACFFAKASESVNWLWHKRLSHLYFKNINKLAKQNKVLGLPSLVYSKGKPCSACEKGKHKRASFKTKQNFSIRRCLHLLYMDLFGPVNPMLVNHEKYTLVIDDDYSRMVENQNVVKVKQIRTDNGTEFRNSKLERFCNKKGISQNFSSPYTPKQNSVAKEKIELSLKLYEKVEYYENKDDSLTDFKTEYSAIVLDDATLSCEPTVSPLDNNETDFKISFDESDDEDYMVVFDENSFSCKIIYVNNLKTDSEDENDKVNLPSSPSPEPTFGYIDDLDFFKDFENEFPAIVYNELKSKLEPLNLPSYVSTLLSIVWFTARGRSLLLWFTFLFWEGVGHGYLYGRVGDGGLWEDGLCDLVSGGLVAGVLMMLFGGIVMGGALCRYVVYGVVWGGRGLMCVVIVDCIGWGVDCGLMGNVVMTYMDYVGCYKDVDFDVLEIREYSKWRGNEYWVHGGGIGITGLVMFAVAVLGMRCGLIIVGNGIFGQCAFCAGGSVAWKPCGVCWDVLVWFFGWMAGDMLCDVLWEEESDEIDCVVMAVRYEMMMDVDGWVTFLLRCGCNGCVGGLTWWCVGWCGMGWKGEKWKCVDEWVDSVGSVGSSGSWWLYVVVGTDFCLRVVEEIVNVWFMVLECGLWRNGEDVLERSRSCMGVVLTIRVEYVVGDRWLADCGFCCVEMNGTCCVANDRGKGAVGFCCVVEIGVGRWWVGCGLLLSVLCDGGVRWEINDSCVVWLVLCVWWIVLVWMNDGEMRWWVRFDRGRDVFWVYEWIGLIICGDGACMKCTVADDSLNVVMCRGGGSCMDDGCCELGVLGWSLGAMLNADEADEWIGLMFEDCRMGSLCSGWGCEFVSCREMVDDRHEMMVGVGCLFVIRKDTETSNMGLVKALGQTDMAPLPHHDLRHPSLRYQVDGYDEGIVHSYEQRLKTIWGRPVNRVHVLDFAGLTEGIRQTLRDRLSMVYAGDDGEALMSDILMGHDVADTLCFQLVGARRRMLNIYARLGDTWDWVAPRPERYEKVEYYENKDDSFTDFETEYSAIVLDDATLSCEPTVDGYDEGIVHSYEQRLKTIWGRPVNRLHVLDFAGLTEGMRQTLGDRLSMVYAGDDGEALFTSHAWRRLFEVRGPLIREFILEFLTTCRMSDIEMGLDVADILCF